MKIRAAVLEEFGQPLNVTDVDLAGPEAGEVLVRLVACGVCHTDLYTASGADPSGYAPAFHHAGALGAAMYTARVEAGSTCVVFGAGLVGLGAVAGKGETLDVIPRWLIQGRRIAGSSFGGVKGRDQVPQLVRRFLDGDIDVDPLVSHRLTLDEVDRGFDIMRDQDGIRSVIEL